MIDKAIIDKVKSYTTQGKDVPSAIAHILVMACMDENTRQSEPQVYACNSDKTK